MFVLLESDSDKNRHLQTSSALSQSRISFNFRCLVVRVCWVIREICRADEMLRKYLFVRFETVQEMDSTSAEVAKSLA